MTNINQLHSEDQVSAKTEELEREDAPLVLIQEQDKDTNPGGKPSKKKRTRQVFKKHKKVPALARIGGTGNWYVYTTLNKKDYRFSLKTELFSEAKDKYLCWFANLGTATPSQIRCLVDLIPEFKAKKQATTKKASTLKAYLKSCDRLERWCPLIMTTPYDKLTNLDILNEWNTLEEPGDGEETGFAKETLKQTRRALRQQFDLAVEKGLLPPTHNLLKGLKLPDGDRVCPKLPSRNIFLRVRTRLYLNTMFLSPESAVFFDVCWQSGGRRSSVCAIQVEDARFTAGTLKFRFGKKGAYTIPLFFDLRTTLQRHITLHGLLPGQRLFKLKGINGSLRTACEDIQKELQAEYLAKGMSEEDSIKASIEDCPLLTHHKLRHLFATHALEEDAPIEVVAAWLGHKDGGVLAMQVYKHLRKDFTEKWARRMCFLSDKWTVEGVQIMKNTIEQKLKEHAARLSTAATQEEIEKVLHELKILIESPITHNDLAPEFVLAEASDPNPTAQHARNVVNWIKENPAGVSMKILCDQFPTIPRVILKRALSYTWPIRKEADRAGREARKQLQKRIEDYIHANPGVTQAHLKSAFPEASKWDVLRQRAAVDAQQEAMYQAVVLFARNNPGLGPTRIRKHFLAQHPYLTRYFCIRAVQEARGSADSTIIA